MDYGIGNTLEQNSKKKKKSKKKQKKNAKAHE